jgi:hypothetical protein
MKTEVCQFIVTPESQRFLTNIAKELPESVMSFSISSFGMEKTSGYGSYNYVMNVVINNNPAIIKKFTHDSLDFDYYNELEYRSQKFNIWVKQKVVWMLSDESVFVKIEQISNQKD